MLLKLDFFRTTFLLQTVRVYLQPLMRKSPPPPSCRIQ